MKKYLSIVLLSGLLFLFTPEFCAAQAVVATGTVTNVHCHGDSTGSIAYQINGGPSPIHYLWNTGDSGVSVGGCTYVMHITNPGAALTGFQVKVVVNHASGMNANFSNVQFTDTLGNVLPFWLQDFPTATTGTFWVRVPSLPTGTTDIYLSFCSAAAVAGNPTGTFEFFDNFDNNTLPLWTQACLSSMSGTSCTISADNVNYFSSGYSAHLHGGSTCFTSPYSGAGSSITRTVNPIVNDSLVLDYEDRVATTLYGFCSGGTGTTNSALNNGASIGNGQSNSHGGSCAATTSGWAPETSLPFLVTTGTTQIALKEYGGDCDNSDGWFDDVRIRKYRAHPPTVVIDTTPRLFLNHLAAGNYIITMTAANGNVYIDTFVVTQPTAVSPVLDSLNVACHGASTGSAWVTSPIGGTPVYTFHWNNAQTTDTIVNLAAGTYKVTVTDGFGCTAVDSVTITQPLSSVSATADSINISCFGQANGKAWVNANGGTPGYTYLWSSASQTTDTISGLGLGNYIVTVTDAAHCTVTTSVNISQPASPLSLSMDSINVNCFGQSTGQASVAATGGTPGYTYLWTNSATTDTVKNAAAGIYAVTVKDTLGCTASATVNVTQPSTAVSVSFTHTDVTCTGLTNGTATAIAAGGTPGYTYLWNTTATTDTISGLGANTYSVTVKDTLGCVATGSVIIAQPASAVSVSIAHTDVTCRGLSNGSAQATAAGGTSGYTYLWNNGQTSSNLTNLSAGSDTVTVTDANGCKASATVAIAPSNDTLTIDTAATAATCGLANGTVKVIPTGGSGIYQYLWSNNASSAMVSGLSGGTYDVVVTDNTGCSGTKSVSIAQLPAISATVTTRNDSCAQQIGSATISIDNGHAPYSYTWIPAGTDPAKLDSGSYSVTITDSLGCVTAASFIIENINNGCNSIILFPTGFTPNGDGKNEVFHAIYTPDLNRFQMRIYDRWGQLVFETDDYTQGWDGTYKNVAQPIGVYIWFAEYNFGNKPTQAKTGNITLIR